MKRVLLITLVTILLASILILPVSCFGGSQSTSTFYDSGASNVTLTGSQFIQYLLYRFDTSSSGRTMILPSAADIISKVPSAVVGAVIVFAVAADGTNPVTIASGSDITIKASAATVAGNQTVMMFCNLDNISSGTQHVTIY